MRKTYLIVNFGGPRDLNEIQPFLNALLLDPEVIRPKLPLFLHKFLFSRVAKKRAVQIAAEYQKIGGKSPIYEDTEKLAKILEEKLSHPVLTFHRYLPSTHAQILRELEAGEEIQVLPLFPQFSYATTGSIARFFSENLSPSTCSKLQWVKSYADSSSYIEAMQQNIEDCLIQVGLQQSEVILFFSAHGLPQKYVDEGDPYQDECEESFAKIAAAFPKAHTILAYQSKFGPGKWLEPSTHELCQNPQPWNQGRRHVVIVPLSFTSDHIETLSEIEHLYLPLIRSQGLQAHRCPALNFHPTWLSVLPSLLSIPTVSNVNLLRARARARVRTRFFPGTW